MLPPNVLEVEGEGSITVKDAGIRICDSIFRRDAVERREKSGVKRRAVIWASLGSLGGVATGHWVS